MAEMTLLCEILRDGAEQDNAEQDNTGERFFCTLKRNGKIKGEWLESCFLDDVSLEREANSTAPQTRQALKATERHSAYSGLPRPFWPDKVEFIGQTVLDATIPQVFKMDETISAAELSMTLSLLFPPQVEGVSDTLLESLEKAKLKQQVARLPKQRHNRSLSGVAISRASNLDLPAEFGLTLFATKAFKKAALIGILGGVMRRRREEMDRYAAKWDEEYEITTELYANELRCLNSALHEQQANVALLPYMDI